MSFQIYDYISTETAYQKPTDVDMVKVCVFPGSRPADSLVKYITGSNDLHLDPLMVAPGVKVNERFTANIVECVEVRPKKKSCVSGNPALPIGTGRP